MKICEDGYLIIRTLRLRQSGNSFNVMYLFKYRSRSKGRILNSIIKSINFDKCRKILVHLRKLLLKAAILIAF